jgi:hypothetical protein
MGNYDSANGQPKKFILKIPEKSLLNIKSTFKASKEKPLSKSLQCREKLPVVKNKKLPSKSAQQCLIYLNNNSISKWATLIHKPSKSKDKVFIRH